MQRSLLTALLLPLLMAAEPIPGVRPPRVEVSVDGGEASVVRRSGALHFQVNDGRRNLVLHYTGHDALKLDGDGNLLIVAAGGTILQEAPVVFQRIGASMRLVSGDYAIENGGEVTLRLGPYDRSRPVEVSAKCPSSQSSAPSAPASARTGLH